MPSKNRDYKAEAERERLTVTVVRVKVKNDKLEALDAKIALASIDEDGKKSHAVHSSTNGLTCILPVL